MATVAKGAPIEIAVQDVNKTHPYTARSLGAKLGKGQNWVAAAASKLELKNDSRYSFAIYGSGGKVALRKYSDSALERIRRELEANRGSTPSDEGARAHGLQSQQPPRKSIKHSALLRPLTAKTGVRVP